MDVKRGLLRLGITLSIIYWGIAGMIAFDAAKAAENVAWNEVESFMSQGYWQEDKPEFRVKVADGRTLNVRAKDRKTAEANALAIAKKFPRHWIKKRQISAAFYGLSQAAVPFLLIAAFLAGASWVVSGFAKQKPEAR